MIGTSRAAAAPRRGAQLLFMTALLASLVGSVVLVPARTALAASATTTTALNLRVGFRTTSKIKLVMPAGSTVDIVNRSQNGFYKVVYQGIRGYAHGDYLNFGGGGSTSGGSTSGNNVSNGGSTGNATVTSSLNLRAGPSTSDRVLLVMPSGASVTLTGQSSNGFLGVTYQGTSGWAHGSYIGTTGQASNGGNSGSGSRDPGSGNAGSAWTTTSLRLRSGPSTDNSIILTMPSGAEVTLTGNASNGFSGVTYNGTRGWAATTYLTTSDPGNGGGGNSGGGASGNYDSNGDGAWSRDEIIAIIYAAADYYGQPRADMLRVAQCESNLDPYNVTPPYSASGLFQFLPGTWATTPYAGESIFDPVASAFATGWMWSVGRRGEWVCQ